jgi:hypothetical protein
MNTALPSLKDARVASLAFAATKVKASDVASGRLVSPPRFAVNGRSGRSWGCSFDGAQALASIAVTNSAISVVLGNA